MHALAIPGCPQPLSGPSATLSPGLGATDVRLPPLQHSSHGLHRLRSRPAILQLGLSPAGTCPAGAPGRAALPATGQRAPVARSPPARLPSAPQGSRRPAAASPAHRLYSGPTARSTSGQAPAATAAQPLGTDATGPVQHRALLLLLRAQELPDPAADLSSSTPKASRQARTGPPSRPLWRLRGGRVRVRAPQRGLLHPALCQTGWFCSPESVRTRTVFTVGPAHPAVIGHRHQRAHLRFAPNSGVFSGAATARLRSQRTLA